MSMGEKKDEFIFEQYQKLSIFSSDQVWSSQSCKAIIALNLCVPIILSGPILSFNQLVIDHDLSTCTDKKTGYNLLNPPTINHMVVKPHPIFSPELPKASKNCSC